VDGRSTNAWRYLRHRANADAELREVYVVDLKGMRARNQDGRRLEA
jgi:hypothetical protein